MRSVVQSSQRATLCFHFLFFSHSRPSRPLAHFIVAQHRELRFGLSILSSDQPARGVAWSWVGHANFMYVYLLKEFYFLLFFSCFSCPLYDSHF